MDRIQATRLARLSLEYLIEECDKGSFQSSFIGLQAGEYRFHDMRDFDRMVDLKQQRPKDQWWMELRHIAKLLAKLGPKE